MAVLLKKRALSEYCQTVQEEQPRPAKRLHIVKRTKVLDSWDFKINSLDANLPPNKLIKVLLSFQQSLPPPVDIREELAKKLIDLLQDLEKMLQNSNYEILCSKVMQLLSNVIYSYEAQIALSRIMSIAKSTESPRLIAHSVQAAFAISKIATQTKIKDNILQFILSHLNSANYLIKIRCLEAVAGLCSTDAGKMQTEIIQALVSHTTHQDNRVRTAAFNALLCLQEREIALPHPLYSKICIALKDDYQTVRETALVLIQAIAENDPNRPVKVGDQHVRLIDCAFTQVCDSINDISVRVRTLAASLLGKLKGVSDQFLLQTLDKKIMSNMKKKSSAHERAKALVSTGDWATGRRWMEDTPSETITADNASVITSGACGAFVHGLEDEFLEVRGATLDAMCNLAQENRDFANQSLDFLVDMFNDEIEEVRLKAILVLQKISNQSKYRPDQLDEILHALKDATLDIRESLHSLLASCSFKSTTCIESVIDAILDNLRQYPQDKRSIYKCAKQIGNNHPDLVNALVPQLLDLHPYFDAVEPNVQDPVYICRLIMILNAASHCPTMRPLLQGHTMRHYSYLRDTMPQLVPQLMANEVNIFNSPISHENTINFIEESLKKLGHLENSSLRLKLTTLPILYSDLMTIAANSNSVTSNMSSNLANISAAASLAAHYIKAMEIFSKILSNKNWLTPSNLSSQQSDALKQYVDQLLKLTLKLRYSYTAAPEELAKIRSLRVRTLALQLVYVVHGSTGSALGLCDNFLEHIESLHKYLCKHVPAGELFDHFIEKAVQELSQLEEPRAGAVARILRPLLLNISVPPLKPFSDLSSINMCWAEILLPAPDNDTVYRLNAGLAVGVQLDAEIYNLLNTSTLRVRVSYPDNTNHLLIPSQGDIRVNEGCHRLLFNVLISAQVWSEACQVGISLVLDTSDQEFLAGRKQLSRNDDTNTVVHLCQPVYVKIWPKQIRKGI